MKYQPPVELVAAAMQALSQRRPIFHSEADFQHALAWEIQTSHPEASIRLEKRMAVQPSIELDVLVLLDGARIGIELKYPRRTISVEVDGELYTLATGADDHGRVAAIEDIARLERLVDSDAIDSGLLVLLTNGADHWLPRVDLRRVLYEQFLLHEGHTIGGTMSWGDWGRPGGRPSGSGVVTLKRSYKLAWRDYSEIDGLQFRYLLVSI